MAFQNEVYEDYKSQIDNLAKLSPCHFAIERYYRSLKQLIVSISPLNKTEEKNRTQYVVFMGVEYLSLVPYWEQASLLIKPLDETEQVLRQIGVFNTAWEHLPYVVYVELLHLKLYIVFRIMRVYDHMPQTFEYNPE